jgi:hypothetical protein
MAIVDICYLMSAHCWWIYGWTFVLVKKDSSDVHAVAKGGGSLEWLPRVNDTATKKSTYIHKTRCGGGKPGEQVKTPTGDVYKKCVSDQVGLVVLHKFPQPGPLCLQTCDQNPECVATLPMEAAAGFWGH